MDDPPDGAAVDDRDRMEAAELSGDTEQLSLFSVISSVATEVVMPEDDGRDDPLDHDPDPALVLDLPAPPLPTGAQAPSGHPTVAGETLMEQKARLRASNASVARDLARWTGMTHAQVNAELNRLAGLQRIGDATAAQLERRLGHARKWMARR